MMARFMARFAAIIDRALQFGRLPPGLDRLQGRRNRLSRFLTTYSLFPDEISGLASE